MICPKCDGAGFVQYPYPCECGGSGVVYCCEGEPSIEREHVSSPYCWCDPEQVEPGVWLHRMVH